MSWGERSCKIKPRCTHEPTMDTCNVNCPHYVWDRKTRPDSVVAPHDKARRQAEHDTFMKRKPLPRDFTRNQRKRHNRKGRGR